MGEVTAGEREGARQIERLSDAEQEELIEELVDYSAFLFRCHRKGYPGGVPPNGHEASDLALMAIERVLTGKRRPWDPEKEPSLLAYLKSVVKSLFSSEVRKPAARKAPSVDSEGNDILAELPAAESSWDDGEDDGRRAEELLSLFEEEEEQLVLMSILMGQTKAAEIASELKLSVKDVYRIKRKIKRRLRGGE